MGGGSRRSGAGGAAGALVDRAVLVQNAHRESAELVDRPAERPGTLGTGQSNCPAVGEHHSRQGVHVPARILGLRQGRQIDGRMLAPPVRTGHEDRGQSGPALGLTRLTLKLTLSHWTTSCL